MASAQAKVIFEASNIKVALGDGERVRWGRPEQELFYNNPRLATQEDVDKGEEVVWCENWSGHRPYQDLDQMKQDFKSLWPHDKFTLKRQDERFPWRFSDWKVSDVGPGEIFLTDEELYRASERYRGLRFAVIEPQLKRGASPNKSWPFPKWNAVAQRLGMSFVQFNPQVTLNGAIPVRTASYREAAAILSHASLYIGHEGGLHHAAAALGIPAVVYYGGFISPEQTGYAGQEFLYREKGSPCGQRVHCRHCQAIADEITTDEALEAIERVLHG